jgi:uncharacterized protein (DUF4415 family)
MELENVCEQRDAKKAQQIDEQDSEQSKPSQQIQCRIALGNLDRLQAGGCGWHAQV